MAKSDVSFTYSNLRKNKEQTFSLCLNNYLQLIKVHIVWRNIMCGNEREVRYVNC